MSTSDEERTHFFKDLQDLLELYDLPVIKAWAFISPPPLEAVVVDTRFKTEEDAWQIGLGWPDEKEIEAAKKKGYRVEKVMVCIPPEPT